MIKNNFYSDLFEKDKVASAYKRLQLSFNNETIFQSDKKLDGFNKVYQQTLVPSYLDVTLDPSLQAQNIFNKKGYAIRVREIDNIDTYLKKHAGNNFKKNTLRSLRRLEQCFNISYTMFFGDIESETHSILMEKLISMIKARFQEREGKNRVIENWDYYTDIAYHLINKKKASLFVIYSDDSPIEISLNFHQGSIMYSAISSFDLNFHKFSLGNIEIYRQLEWCLENDISLFDMGYGSFDYKIKWSNFIYDLNTQVITTKKGFLSKLYVHFLKAKYKSVDYLIKTGTVDTIRHFVSFIKKNDHKENSQTDYTLKPINEDEFNNANKIEVSCLQTPYVQKPLYEFLFSQSEHINNVKIFQIKNQKNLFIFKSPNKKIQLSFVKNSQFK
ncbi:GNAT family N-acetyltransferase [Flavobacteriaceae bacterium GSB9]|nr:GNAT family N-acetyltransferase [Flavobacteriaceae bacterium GSB9]